MAAPFQEHLPSCWTRSCLGRPHEMWPFLPQLRQGRSPQGTEGIGRRIVACSLDTWLSGNAVAPIFSLALTFSFPLVLWSHGTLTRRPHAEKSTFSRIVHTSRRNRYFHESYTLLGTVVRHPSSKITSQIVQNNNTESPEHSSL